VLSNVVWRAVAIDAAVIGGEHLGVLSIGPSAQLGVMAPPGGRSVVAPGEPAADESAP
jgi:hypothetical protein